MTKPNKNRVTAYKKHEYSGPRSSRKRVAAGIKRFHGIEKSRVDVWRKSELKKCIEAEVENERENVTYLPHSQGVAAVNQCLPKNYGRPLPRARLEALEAREATSKPAETVHPNNEPMDIDWPAPDPAVESHQLQVEFVPDETLSGISGYRVVDIKHVIEWAVRMEKHRSVCGGSQINYISENRNGLHSTFNFECSMCGAVFKQTTAKDESINKSFVWGTVTAGSHYTASAHLTGLMDVPVMSATKFRAIEKEIGKVWQDHLTDEIIKAGEQERAIAIKKGHIDDNGVPYITVYVDGGWLKRSYGHNYNSPSGMACIIGKETKKCLFVGVRNKYCYQCQLNDRSNQPAKPHTCFKNFTGPSTAMEADIVVEGFQKSEEMHGLQYRSFIGDGDSSVFASLKDSVSYGPHIRKIECKNHVVKNYTSALYKILSNTKLPLHGRNLLRARLPKLTAVTRKIIMSNCDSPVTMRNHLKNGPLHVFGCHADCQPYYCKWIQSDTDVAPQEMDEDLVQKIKKDAPIVWGYIIAANEAVMSKTSRLSNETTNIAENFMSIINKFNCGKRICFGKGGSYQRRVHAAGLTQITGHKWHQTAWEKCVRQRPGKYFTKYVVQKQTTSLRHKCRVRKRTFDSKRKCQTDQHYGPKASDPVDMSETQLRQECEDKLQQFQTSIDEIIRIEADTKDQHKSDLYNLYRKDRLTASQFGMICKRRATTHCHNHVKQVLYKNNVVTADLEYGRKNEIVARVLFEAQTKKEVDDAGLFIDEEYGFLGASPDGVIKEENAIVEIKCFPSLVRASLSIEEAAATRKDFPLLFNNNVLEMNKKHSYYYQVQGQLKVTGTAKCYFICYIGSQRPITVVEVMPDQTFIDGMIPKLVTFYKNCVLPEIVLRRVNKNQKCIDLSNKGSNNQVPQSEETMDDDEHGASEDFTQPSTSSALS